MLTSNNNLFGAVSLFNKPLQSNIEKKKKNKYKRKNTDFGSHQLYEFKNPQPNYSNFGLPEWIDQNDIEYKLAELNIIEKNGSIKTNELLNNYIERGLIQYQLDNEKHIKDFDIIKKLKNLNNGKQLFWLRIPIYLKSNSDFPSLNDSISLYNPFNQFTAKGKIEEIYVSSPRQKTAYCLMNSFTILGQSQNPEFWEINFVDKKERQLNKQNLF